MDLYSELNLEVVRAEPTVWIRRVAIFEKVTPAPVLIRDIPLTRGLNIVWAEEPEDDDRGAEISGHSAGKTTFCRFLRYLLGEKSFGTKANMDLIRKSIPGGYVAAEVHVAGRKWAVRRPIGSGRGSYIKQDATIEELLGEQTGAVSHDAYVEKLGFEKLLDGVETATIVRTDETIQWGHVLAWCMRDQEARFQSIHEWRSSRSQSESPGFQRPKEGPLFVMRAVLGLFLPDELKGEERLATMQKRVEELETKIEEKRKEPAYWVNRCDAELRRRLSAASPDARDIDTLPFRSGNLLPDLEQLSERITSDLEGAVETRQTELESFQQEIDDLGGQIQHLEGVLGQINALFNLSSTARRELDAGLSKRLEDRQQLKEYQDKNCPFGGVLIRDCSYVIERQTTLRITELQDAQAMEQAEARRAEEMERIETEKARILAAIEDLQRQRKERQDRRDAVSVELRNLREEERGLRQSQQALLAWTDRLEQGVGDDELDSLQRQLADANDEIESLESELTELIQEHDANRTLLASIFSGAVQSVLSSGTYDGQVSLEKRELSFRITHGPAMSGEAIETLSVLLSDVAGQIYNSVSEKSRLPGFFVHDSPREADLGARIYRSFIRALAELQGHFTSPDHVPFQYVLTTTTPPPQELRSDDFVKLRLNAGQETGMLLKMNVAAAEPPDPQLGLFKDAE